jgi:hypothetical protein
VCHPVDGGSFRSFKDSLDVSKISASGGDPGDPEGILPLRLPESP